MDSQPPLYLPRIVDRGGDLAKVGWLIQSQVIRAGIARVTWLKVVEDVGELHGELKTDPLSYLEVLGEGRVQIPARQASKVAGASATRVDAENASPKIIENSGGVGEHVEAFGVICADPV